MANPSLRFKRGTQSAFNSVGLQTGEPAFITDDYNFYIGLDGNSGTNKYFGSARYWTKETASTGSGVNLVEGTNNGAHFITLASPASVGAAVTYYFPASNGSASSVLTNDGSGTLSWSSGSSNPVFTGITTFSTTLLDINSDVDISGITTVSNTTDNTLGNENTGSVQLDGGMGIAKNLTVKQNLHVGGYAEFVGVVTFKGGTINIGDGDGDDINVGGEFISGLVPNTDDSHDLGSNAKRWRNLNVVSVATTNINVTGFSTFTGLIDANGGLDVTGHTVLNNTLVVTGVSTFTGAIDANGGADISGGETILSSATVSDLTATRIVLAGTSGSLVDDSSLTFTDAAGLVVANSGINVTGVSTFSTDLVVGGDIRVNGNDIKDNGGTAAITFDGSGNTTITGNLNINGTTTQVNTTTLTIEDNLIELGKVDGNAPASDLNKDIGMLLHYFDSAARLGAVFYDDSVSRVVVASRVGESSGVLTVDAGYYANFELQGLFVTDTAGSGEAVISYATIGGVTARHLQNITVDGGTF